MAAFLPLARRQAHSLPQIEASLRELIFACGTGQLDERGFVDELLRLEAEKVSPGGFILTAANTNQNWTVVLLHVKGQSEPCAVYEFLPGRGEIRHRRRSATPATARKVGPRRTRKDTEKRSQAGSPVCMESRL